MVKEPELPKKGEKPKKGQTDQHSSQTEENVLDQNDD